LNWNDYELLDDAVLDPSRLSRKEARAAYDRLMETKDVRRKRLMRLLAANGIEFDGSDAAIQALTDWFARSVEPSPSNPAEPASEWLSVAQDIGLLLGDLLIERAPGLEWAFFDRGGPRNLSYRRPVVMGFHVSNRNYNADFGWIARRYAYNAVAGQAADEPDLFLRALRAQLDVACRGA
jgi:hypothetical protein